MQPDNYLGMGYGPEHEADDQALDRASFCDGFGAELGHREKMFEEWAASRNVHSWDGKWRADGSSS